VALVAPAQPLPAALPLAWPAAGSDTAADPDPDASSQMSSALAEEVQSAFAYLPATLIGMLAGVGIVLWLFAPTTPTALLAPWLLAFALLWLLRLLMLQRYRRALLGGAPAWATWHRLWVVATLVSAALWGATGWIFHGRGDGLQQTGLVIVVYSYCIAAVPVLASQPRVYALFSVLCFVPIIVRIAQGGDASSLQLAAELVIIICLTGLLVRTYGQALQRVTELKLQSDALLAQLRIEKRAADAARREAEIASRAKTQFFAAASHDLRQPLHAMGLFAEALRQRTREPEVAQLVNSINESVDALEGLFSELLDITRIDSGGVVVESRDFALADLLRRIALHFEPIAFEKGLALRLRGHRLAVHADPLLVERILRNLVSNAIRYTEDGSVLVSCRRVGAHVRLQVWDTGVGIGEAERGRIFEEFYQVPGRAVVTPDQRRGLGLGLAIVARLARLMGTSVALRSEPGHGSVFTLELPAGSAPRATPDAVQRKGPLDLTLEGRLIVVVEDEPAVRQGLEVLLHGWGATLASFPSVAAVRRWAAACDAQSVRPALVIADYRLEAGANGIDAIVAVRRHLGAQVPAIVVTGSTTSAHEAEAHAHGFHLLIKPVLPNKLRAMIAFKLASASSQAVQA
jgi:signal transduction histidine kinase/CheY-like chemotaxis protein